MLRALSASLRTLPRRPLTATPARLHTSQPAMAAFQQDPHDLLVIPGPIEVANSVLYANAHPSMSHVSKDFVPVFGDSIRMTREVLYAGETTQPFLISGSGTLGWDQVAANLVEDGEEALVLHSGYFADSFADCLQTYRAKVTQVKAPIGRAVTVAQLEEALLQKQKEGGSYKVVTFTHVDTSTGVLSNAKEIAQTVRRISPSSLIIADCVCSVASEEIRFDEWDLDVVMTASQKGLGTPPGLSILLASARAIDVYKSRKTPPSSYYGSWTKWLPIMKAYEAGNPAYFATPPVNLIYAYNASLKLITEVNWPSEVVVSLEERFRLHKEASAKIRAAAAELGLKQLPLDEAEAANGMTALYYPEGLGSADILPRLSQRGIVVAGGLHAECKDKYFRIGHMGLSVVDTERADVDRVIKSLKEVVAEARAEKTT
ncbi:alanine-glyoxylate transaminase [Coprinellus micaceus]|uniref:alanine--glyoxylate transaminase n=1 Tax=Coprinellus micaceus TaxID=71717 RepID=A0A4Y7T556_COPMI|nr:alanine-glyoxylate transaminase [Coprinellus micaceus]